MFVEQKTHRDKFAEERSSKVCKGQLLVSGRNHLGSYTPPGSCVLLGGGYISLCWHLQYVVAG
jgi:hypothetical protein